MVAELHSSTSLAERAFSASEYLVGQARDTCCGAGANLVVVGLPSPRTLSQRWVKFLESHNVSGQAVDPELPDRAMAKICEGLRIPFVAARNHMASSDYRHFDDHWNRRGHRRMSELLLQIHREHGYSNGGSSARGCGSSQ